MRVIYFSRAGRGGSDDILVRTPELRILRDKTIALFGAGCLGAPSALEFARAGVGELRILDDDFVDPATIGRWPFGLSAAGLFKAEFIAQFIASNYPATRVVPELHRLGTVRREVTKTASDFEVMERMTLGAAVIYDATAEIGVQHYLSDLAATLNIPYVAVVATHGGWGGKVVYVDPLRTEGCWMCYRFAVQDGSIQEPPSDPNGEIQPRGCAEITFTGAGFDMAQVALAGVRTAVAVLCSSEEGAYPAVVWDVLTLSLRAENGSLIVPEFRGYKLGKHAQCPRCNSR